MTVGNRPSTHVTTESVEGVVGYSCIVFRRALLIGNRTVVRALSPPTPALTAPLSTRALRRISGPTADPLVVSLRSTRAHAPSCTLSHLRFVSAPCSLPTKCAQSGGSTPCRRLGRRGRGRPWRLSLLLYSALSHSWCTSSHWGCCCCTCQACRCEAAPRPRGTRCRRHGARRTCSTCSSSGASRSSAHSSSCRQRGRYSRRLATSRRGCEATVRLAQRSRRHAHGPRSAAACPIQCLLLVARRPASAGTSDLHSYANLLQAFERKSDGSPRFCRKTGAYKPDRAHYCHEGARAMLALRPSFACP